MNASHFELRFRSLSQSGRALSFPCDAQGAVPLDHLSDKARVCPADDVPAVLHS